MLNLNRVELIGFLADKPEINFTQQSKLATFSVGTNTSWKDKKSGERKEKAQFTRCTIWNPKLVDIVEKHLGKGDYVRVVGSLVNRKYQKADGSDAWITEVQVKEVGFLERKAGQPSEPHGPDLDEEIPY